MKLSHLPITSLLLAAPAWAAPATVVSVEGDGIRIGKDGAWRPGRPGETIAETEFLNVPVNAVVDVKLGDGSSGRFPGKVIVPGRRLATRKDAGPLLRFSESLQKAAESVVGVDVKGTAPGASKANDRTATRIKLQFEGTDSRPRSTGADFAERAFAEHDLHDASVRARAILDDRASSPLEKRRARIVAAGVFLEEAEFTLALQELDAAVAALAPEEKAARRVEKGAVTFDPEAYRAAALLLRGRALRQLGDDVKAKADLTAATTVFPTGTQAYAAHLELMVLALEANDVITARKHFDAIPTMKDADDSASAEQVRHIKKIAAAMLEKPNL